MSVAIGYAKSQTLARRTTLTRNALISLSAAACLFPGCSRDTDLRTDEPELPLVAAYRYPGYPVPGKELDNGLVFAVWPSGRVVRVSGPETVGQSYVEGRVSAEELRSTIDAVRDLQRLYPTAEHDRLVVDAPSVYVYMRLGRRLRVRAESVGPFGPKGFVSRVTKVVMDLPLDDEHEIGGGWRQIPPTWTE
ncbi:MAG: hypothetical protein JSU68_00720 [Phycisphaerales bacterium]|nr:MAG: hypothetical protein JSU68_00720 [Phycisphaerales bacterium]